jgi:hypothetical protein
MTIASTLSKVAPKGLKLPTNGSPAQAPTTPGYKTPKTPQDEALAYFSSEETHQGEPVQVWELWLEDDGGPDDRKSVSHLFLEGKGVRIDKAIVVHQIASSYEAVCPQVELASWDQLYS